MTIDKFNEKYKAFLEEGYYGLDINIPRIILYLDDIFTDLVKIPNFKYYQIKLKFNSIRFYSNLSYELGRAIEICLEDLLKQEDNVEKREEIAC